MHFTHLGFSFVDARAADTVLTAQLRDRNFGFVLSGKPDDLFFGKTAALQALIPGVGPNELQTGLSQFGHVSVIRLVGTSKTGIIQIQTAQRLGGGPARTLCPKSLIR